LGFAVQTKGFGSEFVSTKKAVDSGLKVSNRVEHAALEAPARERGEEAFDGIEPLMPRLV
jgi:hypothetical protein